jgi:hypothetical protein
MIALRQHCLTSRVARFAYARHETILVQPQRFAQPIEEPARFVRLAAVWGYERYDVTYMNQIYLKAYHLGSPSCLPLRKVGRIFLMYLQIVSPARGMDCAMPTDGRCLDERDGNGEYRKSKEKFRTHGRGYEREAKERRGMGKGDRLEEECMISCRCEAYKLSGTVNGSLID